MAQEPGRKVFGEPLTEAPEPAGWIRPQGSCRVAERLPAGPRPVTVAPSPVLWEGDGGRGIARPRPVRMGGYQRYLPASATPWPPAVLPLVGRQHGAWWIAGREPGPRPCPAPKSGRSRQASPKPACACPTPKVPGLAVTPTATPPGSIPSGVVPSWD